MTEEFNGNERFLPDRSLNFGKTSTIAPNEMINATPAVSKDSVRCCSAMTRRLAPTAFLMPISFILFEALAGMGFMKLRHAINSINTPIVGNQISFRIRQPD